MRKETKRRDMTEGTIWKQLLLFFFPIYFGTFFQQLYNMADSVVVGQFVGKEALAAVGGATAVLINLLVGFFVGLSSGATVIIAQFFGAKEGDNVHRSVQTAVTLSIVGGAILTVILFIFSRWALQLIGTPEDIMDYSATYMRIYALGLIPNMVYNIGSGILRAVGDSRRPLYFLIFTCILNIILDVIFVAAFRWEVMGVAVATVLSQLVSAILVVTVLCRSRECYRLNLKKLRIEGNLLRKVFRIGIPNGLQSVMYSLSNIVVQRDINLLGTDTVAAWAAYGKIDMFFWMLISSLGISITTFVGQNYGAQRYDRVRKGTRICLGITFGAAVVLCTVLCAFGPNVYYMFLQDEKVIEIGTLMAYYIVPGFIAYVPIGILSNALYGMGDSLIPTLLICGGICIFRGIWLFTVAEAYMSLLMICLCYPLSWSITAVIFVIYYRKKVGSDPRMAYYSKKQTGKTA